MPRALKETADRLFEADARIHESVEPYAETPLVKAIAVVSEAADQPQMRLICAGLFAAGLLTGNGRMSRAGARMLLAHEAATAAKDLIKTRIDRTRPRSANSTKDRKAKPGNHTAKEETSFPSGHSAGATAAALAFSREFPEHRTAALGAAAAVAAAQVPRCAHYVSDVGAGVVLGALAEAAVNLLWDAIAGREPDAEDLYAAEKSWAPLPESVPPE